MTNLMQTAPVELLSIQEVADVCGVSQRTLYRLMKSEAFPARIRLGASNRGVVRFQRSEIEAWIAASRCQRTEQQ